MNFFNRIHKKWSMLDYRLLKRAASQYINNVTYKGLLCPNDLLKSHPQNSSRRIDSMTDSQELDLQDQERAVNGKSDVIAAFAILSIAVLAGINYVYTGGLLAFLAAIL
tara:strand:+ start:18283 stop:18609 length:327 start_codon:yes stop_codon:yes gene_type:complete